MIQSKAIKSNTYHVGSKELSTVRNMQINLKWRMEWWLYEILTGTMHCEDSKYKLSKEKNILLVFATEN